jgi:hypothetical protein
VERPPILVPRVFRSSVGTTRTSTAGTTRRDGAGGPVTLEALAQAEKHGFVATDLLWLDGQPLDDRPAPRSASGLESA